MHRNGIKEKELKKAVKRAMQLCTADEKTERKKRMQKYIFPSVLIALNIAAGIMCFISKDYKKGVYWLAAAVLNISVTF